MVQENVFTYVLGFAEKNNVPIQKNSLVAGTSYQIKVGTAVEKTSQRAWSRCRTPAAETLQCFFFVEGCWLGMSPTLVVEKTGPREEQAILSLKLSLSFAVRLFCALSACFMHVL